MKSVYESIMTGLTEAVQDAKASDKKLKRRGKFSGCKINEPLKKESETILNCKKIRYVR